MQVAREIMIAFDLILCVVFMLAILDSDVRKERLGVAVFMILDIILLANAACIWMGM